MAQLISTVLLVIVLDFLVSMAESAILEIPLHRARIMAQKKKPGSEALVRLKESSERPIATLISLSNLITVTGSVITGTLAEEVFGTRWVWLFAAALTFFLMVFGEIIPKRLGEQYDEETALKSAPVILFLSTLLLPLTIVLRFVLRPLLRTKTAQTSEEEIRYLAKIGGAEGTIRDYEDRMIQKVFKLNDITAADMMTPRSFVFMMDGRQTLGEAATEVMEARYSTIPIYDRTPDKIIGIAPQRKLLKALAEKQEGVLLKDLADEPLVVPESRLGDNLMRDFQETQAPLAIVVDGRGHVSGVVTLQDIAAELVGENAKEEDIAPQLVKRVAKNEVIVHGETTVGYLNRFFNLELPNHRTVSGFLLDEIGHLPKAGTLFTYHDIEFLVEELDHHNLIEKVRVRKPEE